MALAGQGIEIFKGDLHDEETLRRALADVSGVFGVQDAGEAGDMALAWKDVAEKLPGVHGTPSSGPGAGRHKSHGKIVLLVA